MKSIRSRITWIIVIAIILSAGSVLALGIRDIVELGQSSSEQALKLLCENGEKNLDFHFDSVGQSVEMVASYAEADIESGSTDDLKEHVKRVDIFFGKIARQTNGVLTYYYRLDPSVSEDATGFWYVDANGNGFTEHEVTDITKYDLNDTTQLVWYTVPRASREPVWLPPYITDNLDVRVISYNVPVIIRGQFMGVIGIEIDYTTMAEQVNNIRLYKSGYAFLNDREGNIIYHPSIDVRGLSKEEIPRTP
ncbi:MAG: cache domain-containing protein, partial [Eubacterium sp.]|nr:cache domain-containing protein [Eubacterium sp.]